MQGYSASSPNTSLCHPRQQLENNNYHPLAVWVTKGYNLSSAGWSGRQTKMGREASCPRPRPDGTPDSRKSIRCLSYSTPRAGSNPRAPSAFGERLESWWNLCTQGGYWRPLGKTDLG